MQNEDNDWIIKQVRDTADGLKSLFSSNESSKSEVIFPQENKLNLPHQKEIYYLINQKEYSKAANRLIALKYAMNENDLKKLIIWFYSKVNVKNKVYNNSNIETLISELKKLY